tara:strand:- start:541 stop:1527 length:987 start_codon:yes stop_codon:yes gene_type:complete
MALEDLYNQDIAPLKNTYGLSGEEASYISSMRSADVMPEVGNVIKLQGAIQSQKMNELAFKRSKFEFKKEKEKAQRDAEYIGKADNLFQQFDDIINNSKDSFEGMQQMSNWAMQNAKQLSEHDVTKAIYNAAINRLKSKQAEKDYGLKQQDRLDRNTGQAFNIANYGDAEAVERMINADGEITPNEEAAHLFALQREQEKKEGKDISKAQAEHESRARNYALAKEAISLDAAPLDAQIKEFKAILEEAPVEPDPADDTNQTYIKNYSGVKSQLRAFGGTAETDPEDFLRGLIKKREKLNEELKAAFLRFSKKIPKPSAGSGISSKDKP